MPTYEYECEACGHRFEKFQSITASALRKCPGCGRRRLRRLIGAGSGVIFKGSGFYQTDYRSDSYQKAAKKEDSAGKDKPADKSDKKASEGDTKASKKKPE